MRRAAALLALTGAVLAAPGPAAASAPAASVVSLRDGAPAGATAALERRHGFRAGPRFPVLGAFGARLTPAQRDALRDDPAVLGVEPDSTFRGQGTVPTAGGESVPPGVRRIGAATGPTVHASSSAGVAVVDTGVDLRTTDLAIGDGTNCVTAGAPPADDHGHGTHVAGIVAARNQGAGLVGVAPGTRVHPVKVLDAKNSGSLSQVLCGVNWLVANAAAKGIRVANLSIGGSGKDDGACGAVDGSALHRAVCSLTRAGVTVVVSAGNASRGFGATAPAAFREVLTVTAITDTDGLPGAKGPAPCSRRQADDRYADFSNFGVTAAEATHTIAAPGVCVVSLRPGGGTATSSGTSQAAPHVTGVVASCLGSGGLAGPCATLTPAQVVARVRADAMARATVANGFAGDLLRPVSGRVYGPLVTSAGY